MSKVVDGRLIAEEIKQKVKEKIGELKTKGYPVPRVATVKVGENKESDLFLKLKDKACEKAGIKSFHIEFPKDSEEKEVIEKIRQLNVDEKVHGIVVQFPLPKHMSMQRIVSSIDPGKDVEGLHPFNMGRTLMGDEFLVPCTPLAVLTILRHEKVELKGGDVVIVNHSVIVGKPLAALLLNRNATVSVCHVFTKSLKQYTRNADVLVTATGVPGLIGRDHVKEGAVVVDVGITKTAEGVCGDVVFDEVQEIASIVTPVPGGVGPVTVACSLENMLKTYRNCVEEKR